MEDRTFDKYTGAIHHEDEFNMENNLLYVTPETYPVYNMDNQYIGMVYCNDFEPIDEI